MQIPSQNVKKLAFFNENIPLIVVSMETICMAKSQDAQSYVPHNHLTIWKLRPCGIQSLRWSDYL